MWAIIIAIAAIIIAVLWKLREEDNPLDKVPGPPRLPIAGNAFEFFNINTSGMFQLIRRFFKTYGDRFVVKVFHRRVLHVCRPQDIEIVLSHSKNISKSMPYSFLEPWLGTGLLLSKGAKWHKRRKILTPTFHFNILKNFASTMEEKSGNFIKRLQETGGKDVDVMATISDFTLSTICETAMGTQLDTDTSAKTQAYKNAILQISKLMLSRLTTIWLHNNFLFWKSSIGKKFNNCLIKIHSFADEVIEKRRERRGDFYAALEGKDTEGKKRLAMLDLLLEAEVKGEIDLDGIKEEVNTFMFEGFDTTAVALTYALMYLANDEEIQERVHEEYLSVMGNSDRKATMADWANMKYLEAVIKETLRLNPSVPFIARTITEDFMLDGLEVKARSEVAVHIYELHHRPDIYPEPEVFRPERFLNGETRHPYAYVPFSAGPRNCIGQKFAMLEMKCVLTDICRAFHLKPKVQGARAELTSDLVLRPKHNVYVRFIPREG